MDFIRSCYTTTMRFELDGPAVPVRWFFAKEDAKILDGYHAFYSQNWENEPDKYVDLGEQSGPRRWSSGLRIAGLDGQRLCDPIDFFENGQPLGLDLRKEVTKQGVPVCCTLHCQDEVDQDFGDITVYRGCGGVLYNHGVKELL